MRAYLAMVIWFDKNVISIFFFFRSEQGYGLLVVDITLFTVAPGLICILIIRVKGIRWQIDSPRFKRSRPPQAVESREKRIATG